MSRIQDGNGVARSAYARHASELAGKLVAAGQARPRLPNSSLLETEMVRRRRTMFVGDAQGSPNTHRELVAITKTQAYVAAPLVNHGNVVGLLHADKNADAGRVSDLDQERACLREVQRADSGRVVRVRRRGSALLPEATTTRLT